MFKTLFLLLLTLHSVANAETTIIANKGHNASKAEACQDAKRLSREWGEPRAQISKEETALEVHYGSCECSSKKVQRSEDEWVCIVKVAIDEIVDAPTGETSQNRPFADTYTDKNKACSSATSQAKAYVGEIKDGILNGISACKCEARRNGTTTFWTCKVDARFTAPF